MSTSSPSIQTVAVLLRSLDLESRCAILDRMSGAVREEIVALLREPLPDGIQDADMLTREFVQRLRQAQARRAVAPQDRLPAPSTAGHPPSEFDLLLDRAPTTTMQQLVSSEHPQTVAVIIAHLSPDRAACLLQLTSAERRAEILQRVIELEDSDAQALQDIRDYLTEAIVRKLDDHQKSAVRVSRVQAICGAADPRLKAEIRRLIDQQTAPPQDSNLTMHDRAESALPDAASTSVRFDRIVDVSDEIVSKIFRGIPADVAAVALAGASQPARKDLLQRLPPAVRSEINAHMTKLGPTRVTDIQLAQQIVLSLVEKMLHNVAIPQDVRVILSA